MKVLLQLKTECLNFSSREKNIVTVFIINKTCNYELIKEFECKIIIC